ncbi:G2/mitotic-specific cyclin-B-like [Agrilus planipennis]|uniref:G2/mitotic-specific cyclin-B n=1 Tax=Agrilus planipennis TaxID=224129 RepID=A0A7F5RIE0_AGRPL|nr:G2/mitotic-specific cyclin-B [Agrilus planipennis]XP_025835746.1 G2/mitotic-specific cyclin-B-like [Agrilus planipennis]
MASRIRNLENSTLNRENIQRFPSKVAHPVKPVVAKRTALGELGNKIHVKQNQTSNTLKNVDLKKNTQINLEKKSSQVSLLDKKSALKKDVNAQVKDLKGVKNAEATKQKNVIKDIVKSYHLENRENINLKQALLISTRTEVKKDEISYSRQRLTNIVDADVNDKNDPQLVSNYVKDIYAYLLELELKCMIKEDFLDSHATTPRMRSILVNWMVEVAISFGYLLETLHMSVAIVDRYLQQNKKVDRETLQLVGSTGMLIAGKYEELYWPEVQEIVYICDDMYSRQQVLATEREIIKKLEFDFSRPLSIHFLRRYNKIAGVTAEEHSVGKYFLELCLLEYNLCHYRPSCQAAATFCLVQAIFNDCTDPSTFWTETMIYYSGHEYRAFKCIIPKLAETVMKMEISKYPAIRKKYSSAKFGKVSLHPRLKGEVLKEISGEQTK